MTDEHAAEDAFRMPRASIAILFTLMVPGLGHLYAGCRRRGLVYFLVTYAVLFLATPLATVIGLAPWNVLLAVAVIVAAWASAIVDVAVLARRCRSDPPADLGPGGLTLIVIGLAVNAVLFVTLMAYKTTCYEGFTIPSGSMEDTIIPGDRVIVEKFAYGLRLPLLDTRFLARDPERGDIVIYLPADRPDTMFMHRLVALPGDMVEVRDHRLLINQQPVDEPFVKIARAPVTSSRSPRREDFGPERVPEGMAFVLGDNRASSLDSRYAGFVPLSSIYGQVKFIYWSRPRRASFGWVASGDRPVRWSRIGQAVR